MKRISRDLPLLILLISLPFLWTWVPRFAPFVLGAAAIASLCMLPRSRWRELFRSTPVVWVMLGMVFYAACSTLWHYEPSFAWAAFPRVFFLLLAFCLVLRIQTLVSMEGVSIGTFERFFVWVAMCSFLFYALHLLLFPFLRPFLLAHLQGSSAVTHAIYRFSPGAAMITLMIWPVLHMARSHFPLWKNPFWDGLLTCSFLFLPLILFFMKADVDSLVVAFSAAILVYYTLSFAPRLMPRLVSGGMIMGAWIAPFMAYHSLSSPKLEALVSKLPSSWEQRVHIWHFVAEKIYEKPLLGWGFFSARYFPGGSDSFPLASGLCIKIPMHPHNFLLQLWLDFGVIAPLFITAMVILLWRYTRQHPSCARVFYPMATAYFTLELFSFSVWQSWLLAMVFISGIFACRAVNLKSLETRQDR